MHTECVAVWSSQSCCQAVGSSYLGRLRAGADCAIGANDDTARGRSTSFAHGATRAPRPASWKPLLEPAVACCSHGWRAAGGEKQPQYGASARTAGAYHSRFAPGSGERRPWQPSIAAAAGTRRTG